MLERLKFFMSRDGLLTLRFGLVGVVATGVHTGVALTALSLLHRPLLANLCGFLTAFVFSFLGHCLWTFKMEAGRKRAARRFFVVSGCSFLFSTVVLAACVASGLLPNAVSVLISIVVIPVCNYVAARLWAFAPPALDGAERA